MKTLVIRNPNSGKLKAEAGKGESFWEHIDAEHLVLKDAVDLDGVLRDAIQRGIEMVVAAGGDGTVNAVVNALMHLEAAQRPAMGIIPLGTANDFAWTLGLSDDPQQAWELVQTGVTRTIDVIEMTTASRRVYLVNVAAGGNSVKVTESITDELKQQWGPLVYARGAIAAISQLESFKASIELDDEKLMEQAVWAVLVANGKTNAGRLLVAPDASPYDGLLDLVIIEEGNLLDLADVGANLVLGNYLEHPLVHLVKSKSLTIRSDPPMKFTVDGEVVDEEPVGFRVIEGAIRMIAGLEPHS